MQSDEPGNRIYGRFELIWCYALEAQVIAELVDFQYPVDGFEKAFLMIGLHFRCLGTFLCRELLIRDAFHWAHDVRVQTVRRQ